MSRLRAFARLPSTSGAARKQSAKKQQKPSSSHSNVVVGLPTCTNGTGRKQSGKNQQKTSSSSSNVMVGLPSSSSEPAAASLAIEPSTSIRSAKKRPKPSGETNESAKKRLKTSGEYIGRPSSGSGPTSGIVHSPGSGPAKKRRN